MGKPRAENSGHGECTEKRRTKRGFLRENANCGILGEDQKYRIKKKKRAPETEKADQGASILQILQKKGSDQTKDTWADQSAVKSLSLSSQTLMHQKLTETPRGEPVLRIAGRTKVSERELTNGPMRSQSF